MVVFASVLVRDKLTEETSGSLFLFEDLYEIKLPLCRLLREIYDFIALEVFLAVIGEEPSIYSWHFSAPESGENSSRSHSWSWKIE